LYKGLLAEMDVMGEMVLWDLRVVKAPRDLQEPHHHHLQPHNKPQLTTPITCSRKSIRCDFRQS
jgi:hypothetical protein